MPSSPTGTTSPESTSTVARQAKLDKANFDYEAVARLAKLGITTAARIAVALGYKPHQVYNARKADEEFKDLFDLAMDTGSVAGEEKILGMMWDAANEGESWAIKELAKRLAPLPKEVAPKAAGLPPVTLSLNVTPEYLEDRKREALEAKGIVEVEVVDESDS
jgi:hypothetical protein